MTVRKAIIPVAGWGTRRLPVTKTIDKCMLPLLNRPIVDYAVQECVQAGITDIYFVISGPATQLRSYYEHNAQLESYLDSSGKQTQLADIMPPKNVTFHYIEQDLADPRYGTTVPLWLCRDYIGGSEQFLVVNGDQHIYREDGGNEAKELISQVSLSGADGGIIGIPIDDNGLYQGLFVLKENGDLAGINEFPEPGDKTSNLKNPGFYLFSGDVMKIADKHMSGKPSKTGEYLVTDVVTEYVQSHKLTVYRAKGQYFDCGTLESWVRANNELLELTSTQN
jgi:UTP--glucose-1-phosphate uridylyltransferase